MHGETVKFEKKKIKSDRSYLSIINIEVKHKQVNTVFKKLRLTSVIFRCLEIINNVES